MLFTFLADRYERRSVLFTSNPVFSQWDKSFQDPMTTACAIDRLIHHAVVLEMSGKSLRAKAAENQQQARRAETRRDRGFSTGRAPFPRTPHPGHGGERSAHF